MAGKKTPRRAVIVGGVRTPFVRAFREFLELDTIDLGTAASRALIERFDVPRDQIDSIVWGGVVLPSAAPNLARRSLRSRSTSSSGGHDLYASLRIRITGGDPRRSSH